MLSAFKDKGIEPVEMHEVQELQAALGLAEALYADAQADRDGQRA